jgi:hypothetical protein
MLDQISNTWKGVLFQPCSIGEHLIQRLEKTPEPHLPTNVAP